MDTSKIIDKLKNSIFTEYLSHLDSKLSDVLSFCESPIEHLFLLQFINFFLKNLKGDIVIPFNGIEFIEESLWNDGDKKRDKILKYNYRFDGVDGYSKYFGFKVQLGVVANNLNHAEIQFYPQYEVNIENIKYRVDIAAIYIIRDYYSDEIVKTRKFAIECDGYDYHNKPDKFKEDKIRERMLKRNGWVEVLRYSGSEIYEIGDDMKKTKHNFQELIEIIRRI